MIACARAGADTTDSSKETRTDEHDLKGLAMTTSSMRPQPLTSRYRSSSFGKGPCVLVWSSTQGYFLIWTSS